MDNYNCKNWRANNLSKALLGIIIAPAYLKQHGDVLELADKHDLGSCAVRRVGSTPTILTKIKIEP